MQNFTKLALFVLLTPLLARAADTKLFQLSVAEVPAENGKVLNMEFQEVAREPASSTVLITRRSGGSVSSSMFILRGMCGLARARGKQNFVTEQLAGDTSHFTVTFPEKAPEPGKGFTLAQCVFMQF